MPICKICFVHFITQNNARDYRTLFKMASRSGTVYRKYEQVFEKHQKGLLLGQKEDTEEQQQQQQQQQQQKNSKAQIRLYLFRTLGAMDEASCMEILDLVLNREIELGQLELTAKTSQHLQNIQAALMGCIDPDCELTWDVMERRFPVHTKRSMLLNLFGKVSTGSWFNILFQYKDWIIIIVCQVWKLKNIIEGGIIFFTQVISSSVNWDDVYLTNWIYIFSVIW